MQAQLVDFGPKSNGGNASYRASAELFFICFGGLSILELNLTLRLQKKKSYDIFKKIQNFQKKIKTIFSILRPRK